MKEIYLDNSATTPVCAAARDAALAAMTGLCANPSSLHSAGFEAERTVSRARETLLAALGSDPASGRIVFTGCGSEANNLAVLGAARAKRFRGTPRLVTTDSEHPSVAEQAKVLAAAGWEIRTVPTKGGVLDLDTLDALLTPDTAIVSLMLVNNETGARYDLPAAFRLARQKCPGAFLHTDAVQAFLKVPFSVKTLGCDALTVSAHKIGGLKGVGALWYSAETEKKRRLSPVIYGGGQENGLRGGTENVPGIAAFAAAIGENRPLLSRFGEHTRALTDRIARTLTEAGLGVTVNRPPVCAPHILSVTNPRVRSETLVHFLSARGIYMSAGSACSSHAAHLSPVLPAFGLDEAAAGRTVRVSLSLDTTGEDADAFCAAYLDGVSTLAGR